eukprot:5662577-Prymnesium_polylepis.1
MRNSALVDSASFCCARRAATVARDHSLLDMVVRRAAAVGLLLVGDATCVALQPAFSNTVRRRTVPRTPRMARVHATAVPAGGDDDDETTFTGIDRESWSAPPTGDDRRDEQLEALNAQALESDGPPATGARVGPVMGLESDVDVAGDSAAAGQAAEGATEAASGEERERRVLEERLRERERV